jgi:1A family penicillin-binding protein
MYQSLVRTPRRLIEREGPQRLTHSHRDDADGQRRTQQCVVFIGENSAGRREGERRILLIVELWFQDARLRAPVMGLAFALGSGVIRIISASFFRDWRPLRGRPRTLVFLVGVCAIVSFLAAGTAAWFSYELTAGLPARDAIAGLGDMAQSTTIFDASDRPAFTIFKEQRIEIPLDRMSPNFLKAVLSVEDQRFYDHGGVDAIRVAAAALRNVQEGRRAEGGSTITQQLARLSFLSRDKTFKRKLKEIVLAGYIESEYTKQQILEMYLNKAYFGDGLYGIEAASRGYFAKSASDLTVDEAALLAGLIQSPSSYAPSVNLERALARRAVVLQTMVSSGAIDAATAERARTAPVKLTNGLEIREKSGLYFKEQVRRELVERFGWQRVYQGGLRVFTTIDPDLQSMAERLVEKHLEELEKKRGFKHPPRDPKARLKEGATPEYVQAAIVSMDPATGHVRAMVGGRDFADSRFNRAVQAKRQSGSAFKPFVYAAALESGQSPATLITRLNDPTLTPEGEWLPEDEHSDATQMTLRTALRTSSNRAAVQLLHTVGIDRAVDYAKRLNVGTPPSVPSLALGASDVSLLQLTSAYSAFANGGFVRRPVMIRRVEDGAGTVLYTDEGKADRAISESTAFLMASMLADVINAGTAYRARQAGFVLPAAGKTGTTNDYNDAWFVGFTPKIVTGVWIGFDQPRTIISNGYAGDVAVPLWGSFMKEATRGDKPEWLPKPASVVALNVCRISGMLPGDGCTHVDVVNRDGFVETRSMVFTEYFVRGTQPTTECPIHGNGSFIDAIAGVFGQKSSPPPVPADSAGLPSTSGVSTTGSPAPAAEAAPPTVEQPQPAKRRGFWSRVFGVGKKDDDKKKEEERKKQGIK